jgi:glycosyltransferase involved in cell wall biosynthesis/O-antigen ligase
MALFVLALLGMIAGRFDPGRLIPGLTLPLDIRWFFVVALGAAALRWRGELRTWPGTIRPLQLSLVPLGAYCLYMTLSAGWAPDGARTASYVLDFVFLFVLVAAALLFAAADPRRATTLLWLVIAVYAVFAVLGSLAIGPTFQGRYSAPGGGPNVFVRIMALGVIGALYFSARPRGARTAFLIPLFLLGAVLSGSRGGLLALGIVAVVGGIPMARRMPKAARRWLMLLMLVGAAGVYAFAGARINDFIRYRFIKETLQNRYLSGRNEIVGDALELFREHLVFGAGLDGYYAVIGSVIGYQYPHNLPVATAAEGGLVGLALLLAAIVLPLRYALRRPLPAQSLYLLLGALFLFIASLFSGNYYDSRLMWLLLGLAALRSAQRDPVPPVNEDGDRADRPMRIAYLHQYFATPDMSAGTRSYEFARRMVRDGHEVHLITTDRTSPSKGWRVSDVDGITVHWLGVPYSNSMSNRDRIGAFFSFAVRAVQRTRDVEADVVFATSSPLTIAIPAVGGVVGTDTPVVMEIRDLWPDTPIAMGALKNPVARFLARLLEAFAYRHSTRIVALSPGMADGVAAAGYPSRAITVVPNAADRELFAESDADGRALRKELPWLGDRPLVAYIGTIGRVNGMQHFVRLARAVQDRDEDVRFVIVGDGIERDPTRALAEELGVYERTLFMLPPVTKLQVPAFFGAATISSSFVQEIPALAANSANKVFDGLAAGRPILINHGGWQADLLREHDAGIVLTNDYEADADLLVGKLRDPAWLEAAGERAAALARDQFDRDLLYVELARVLTAARAQGRVTRPVRWRR